MRERLSKVGSTLALAVFLGSRLLYQWGMVLHITIREARAGSL